MAHTVYFLSITFAVAWFLIKHSTGQQCSSLGPQCDPCNIVLCTALNATPILVSNCSANEQHCVENDSGFECQPGACSDPNVPHPFLCTGPGVFPSPYKCDISYFCSSAGSIPVMECICDPGQSFNGATGECDDGKCNSPVICNSTGETGDIDVKNCFICDPNLDALVFECPTEDDLDESIFSIYRSDRGFASCRNYTGPLPGNNTSPSPPPTGPSDICKIPGFRYPDPDNCRSYYECDSALTPRLKVCPLGGHYDENKFACVSGSDC